MKSRRAKVLVLEGSLGSQRGDMSVCDVDDMVDDGVRGGEGGECGVEQRGLVIKRGQFPALSGRNLAATSYSSSFC